MVPVVGVGERAMLGKEVDDPPGDDRDEADRFVLDGFRLRRTLGPSSSEVAVLAAVAASVAACGGGAGT